MATVKELKATARPKAGKGAARAERRAGRTPGVIYGDNKPPLNISLDHADIRTRIYAGRFLTTLYDIEVDGQKHRVIPRDFQLDAVKDFPIHVDFMRLGDGATIRVRIPVHVHGAEASPGVKRGGTVNIVMHSIAVECPPDQIPDAINVDYKDGQLLMFFTVKPGEAMPLKGKLTFGVYDPTMYAAMDFASDDDLVAVGDKFAACKRAVVRPDPDEVLAQNQDSLTEAFFNDPAGTDMSKLFATRLEMTC